MGERGDLEKDVVEAEGPSVDNRELYKVPGLALGDVVRLKAGTFETPVLVL